MTRLCALAMKHGCNKTPQWGQCGHSYTPFYDGLFGDRVVRRLLEIGIWQGASLRMWEEYFPTAEIIGVDINPANLVNAGRIRSYQCDQADEVELQALANRLGGEFDVIIDDGSHNAAHQAVSANVLMPFLATNGVYVIEDVQRRNVERLRGLIEFSSILIEFDARASAPTDDRMLLLPAPIKRPKSVSRSSHRTFVDRGRTWECIFNKESAHWVGTSTNPDIQIVAECWDDLTEELAVVDITTVRRDAVAIAELPLPEFMRGR